MKKHITTTVEVDVTDTDVRQFLSDADPLTRFATLYYVIRGFPADELRLLVNTYPEAVRERLVEFTEFCDKTQALLDFDPNL